MRFSMAATFSMRDAATLLLVRDTPTGLEVFMVERPGAADFGGMHVFPGGKVDIDDASVAAHCVALTDAAASEQLGIAHGGMAFWSAAIREAFEEAGVLLAYHGEQLIDLSDDTTRDRFADHRDAVHKGNLSIVALCEREQLRLATDRVHYFSHWITPLGPPRRYDTRFFLAHMPENQETAHHEHELEDGVWIRPVDALAHYEAGRWTMIFPTLTTLQSLARHTTVSALEAAVLAGTHLPEVTPERNRQGMQALR
jgi:8-oxo-dGTP pyrophosphatase MutT (NUDIX family)